MNGTISIAVPRAALLLGLALWMSIAALNNATDPQTNVTHLEVMLSMSLLAGDPVFGNGLEWRAWQGFPPVLLLGLIVLWQSLTAIALWMAAVMMCLVLLGRCSMPAAVARANLALTMFMIMWLFFLCGGLWFGYWMKQGAIQGVHFTMLILSILSLILINRPDDRSSMREQ